MYNEERKRRFIEENYTNEETQKSLISTFEKAEYIEQRYDVDICNYNWNQLVECLVYFDCSTIDSLGKEFSKMNVYADWCAAEGYCPPNMAFKSIYRRDLKKYINTTAHKNQYIESRDVLYQSLEEIVNDQEKVIPILLYEGAWGRFKKEFAFEELRNLRLEDCQGNSIKVTREDGTFRILDNIDKRSMKIIQNAIEQTEFYSSNGFTDFHCKAKPLVTSPYVLKQTARIDNPDVRVSPDLIEQRVRRIKKITNLPYINAKNIFYSGMFDRLQKIESEREITRKDYEDVMRHFGQEPTFIYKVKPKYEEFKNILKAKS